MAKAKPKTTAVKPTLPSVHAWLRQHVKEMVGQATKLQADAAKKNGQQAELLNGTFLYFAYMGEFTGRVLKDGELFTELVPGNSHWKKRKKPQPKDCFFNAQTLCLVAGLPYYEGFYFSSVLPMQHAFNVLDGKVIDVTKEAIDNLAGPTEGFWFGVPVSRKALQLRQMNIGQWGPALLPDTPAFDD